VLYRFGFYLLIVFSPLLLGSNRPLFWGINGVLSALILIGFVWFEFKNEPSRFDWKLPFVAIVSFLLIGVWMAVQASPWTPRAWHHPIWFASPMLAKAKSTISIDPSQTWQAIGWWSTLSVFVVAIRLGTTLGARIFVLNIMVIVCGVVAAFGLIVEFFGFGTLGLIQKTYYQGWLTGTFVNRNSAASFISIGLIVVLALAVRKRPARQNRTPSVPWYYSTAALMLFLALILTGSRAGIVTGVIGAFLVLLMGTIKRDRLNRRAIVTLVGGLAICAALSTSVLLHRTETSESTAVRLSLYEEALKAIADRPILGHGAGTFSSVEPLYHSSSTPSNLIWDNAHSTLLEILVTLGIPATTLALVVLLYILSKLARTLLNTAEEATCLLTVLAITVAVSLHALVDFSLEIQAIALYVANLFGLAIGETMSLTSTSSGQIKLSKKRPITTSVDRFESPVA
jgi:O-antigen ligase